MKLYLSSTLCWAFPINDVIRIAKLLDFDGVEIWAEHVWHYQTPIDVITAAKEMSDMDISLHAASWDLNLSALNAGLQKQAVIEVENSILLAKKLGAANITIHPGKCTLPHERMQRHEQVLLKSLVHFAKIAEDLGVVLSLEQMEPVDKEFITTPEAINRLLAELPESVSATFDVAHVPLHSNPEKYYREIDRISKVHLSDATNKHYHVPLGTGELQLTTVMRELEHSSLPVVIEGFDDQRSLSLLQKNLHYLQEHNLLRRRQAENLGH